MLILVVTHGERWWVRNGSRPLDVMIYPVAADAAGAAYLTGLRPEDFQEIGEFFASQGRRWRKQTTPAPVFHLRSVVHDVPPLEPARNAWEAIRLSLRLRWYAYRHTPFWGSFGRVRLFVLYHDAAAGRTLPDSHGMQKGLLGVVHVFASDEQRAQNNIVIAHELLHTLGATDKYDAAGLPVFPGGFAESTREPRYPQERAEIMAGRIPVSADRAEIPASLAETVVGYVTASELGW